MSLTTGIARTNRNVLVTVRRVTLTYITGIGAVRATTFHMAVMSRAAPFTPRQQQRINSSARARAAASQRFSQHRLEQLPRVACLGLARMRSEKPAAATAE